MSSENNQEFCSYLLNAAKYKGMKNIIFVVIPDICRPIDHLPEILLNIIKNAKGLIYIHQLGKSKKVLRLITRYKTGV